jgi:uncharacterized membrane protein
MVTENERYREGQIVGWTLRIGAYGSVGLIVLGLLLMLVHAGAGEVVLRAGFLLLMFTPALRIIVAGIVFFREGDYKYALVSVVVLTIVVGTSALAMLGVLKNFER